MRTRGLVADITRPDQLEIELQKQPQTVYLGVDPTARSLHVGHLVPLLSLFHFQLRGHQIIPLIGGATGLIGDPSGRSTERPLTARETIEYNVAQLTAGIKQFFERAQKYAEKRIPSSLRVLPPNVQNNFNWLKDLSLLEFLRTVGFHSRVNTMLTRESVQARLSSQQGISFTEFTYQLLQAYDFLTLHKTFGCTIQVGGSDQWGNIIAGIDLINRANSQESGALVEKGFGITTPLLTTASGQKFGKSAGNAISLNEDDTSVFELYQFFLRSSDADVGRYLKMFTLLSLERVDTVMETHNQNPEARSAQRLLAEEVTELVHGEDGVARARLATKIIYERDISTAKTDNVLAALRGNPVLHVCDASEVLDVPLTKLATTLSVASSNNAARQLVASKGLYLNNTPVADVQQKLTPADFIDERLAFLRAGSQKVAVVALK
ncbi:hypothetical protein DICSQDRAFT_79516 [Dichomitus squalens LYAD-421 SS1]|uniref:uncharacterized protein n=1 Tax=Dichomitus squalens (strain LYAD-421) TaxID=732165 RepID=UPI0004411677|nr:uncharacterized protein DICSQDRAFT_79516 [Dichomitus squalens LYAD-421 SS1]EJF65390.1 hypothetical protein DICSQDRAFT_79516 [Dichomitus squalens LYAD-421 SS1]